MKHNLIIILFFLFAAIALLSVANAQNNIPVKVELKNENGIWTLYRAGQPYFIKGAGGYEYMDRIAAYGGNSIRTWGYDNAEKILDEAQKYGLTVMLGLWVGCERQGFDYDDTAAVKNQLKIFTEAVKKYRNHPALLLWGVGNEMDLQYTNPKVWNAVEDICKMIHALDPNHPAVTVTAGFHQEVMDEIIKRVPSLDIYGVNTYADLPNMPERIAKSGWKGPFIVTEWGATGQWECAKTAWNQPIEETSKEKSKVYYERCQKGILAPKDKCLGSYVFLWGHKQEVTSTWYGFFTLKGEQSEVVDVIQYLWSGKFPENKAPSLDSVFLDKKTSFQNIYLYPGNFYPPD
ncbi:MAG: glycoside hydrolase family 2 TIM barrel-domain containing protein, partial [Bacteroidales bacterium]|nr:glycoside hydrolase family 2 TIM barrel-domain containing protein [Bacteroidales bacterium]